MACWLFQLYAISRQVLCTFAQVQANPDAQERVGTLLEIFQVWSCILYIVIQPPLLHSTSPILAEIMLYCFYGILVISLIILSEEILVQHSMLLVNLCRLPVFAGFFTSGLQTICFIINSRMFSGTCISLACLLCLESIS